MMGFRLIGCAGAAALMLVATAAHAVCEYRGVMGAQSTIAQEFEDSQWVVRVAVLGGDYHWSDEGESWTTYRLKVLQSYKGQSPAQITLFTMRDSGGFYLDGDNAMPDLDQEYLLFLNPLALDRPPRDARQVNYSCGKSGRWNVVPAADRAELARLSSSPR